MIWINLNAVFELHCSIRKYDLKSVHFNECCIVSKADHLYEQDISEIERELNCKSLNVKKQLEMESFE